MNRAPGRFRIGPRLGWAALIASPLTLLVPLFIDGLWPALITFVGVNLTLALLAFRDSRALSRLDLEVRRKVPRRLRVGERATVTVELKNPASRSLSVRAADTPASSLNAIDQSQKITLAPLERAEFSYAIQPSERGDSAFESIHLHLDGGWGLGGFSQIIELPHSVQVYPRLSVLSSALRSALLPARELGLRRTRKRRGQGEFELLREYAVGDPYRRIDWKSTAKRNRPVTRVYQQEKNQDVVLVLDHSRGMGVNNESLGATASSLDRSIEAALVLAQVALKASDRVGLLSFAGDVTRFVPPKRGPAQYRALLKATYNLKAIDSEGDLFELVRFLRVRVPKRALIVLLTDLNTTTLDLDAEIVRDAATESALGPLRTLNRNHLLVCVSPRDGETERLEATPLTAPLDVFRRMVADDERERIAIFAQTLAHAGIHLIHAKRGQEAPLLVNRYLDIKSRGLL